MIRSRKLIFGVMLCALLTVCLYGEVSYAEDEEYGRGNVAAPDYEYTVNADGTITITNATSVGHVLGESKDHTVPAQIDGLSVSEIGEGAYNGAYVYNLYVPGTIRKVGESAFSGTDGLSTVTLEEGVTEIGAGAFCNPSLVAAHVPVSVQTIGEDAFPSSTWFTLHAPKGSYAAAYAAENGYRLEYTDEYVIQTEKMTLRTDDVNAKGGDHACLECDDLTDTDECKNLAEQYGGTAVLYDLYLSYGEGALETAGTYYDIEIRLPAFMVGNEVKIYGVDADGVCTELAVCEAGAKRAAFEMDALGKLLFVSQQTILHGDVDQNGSLDTSDALLVLQDVVGLQTLTEKQAYFADKNGDGEVDAVDALEILQAVVGISRECSE